MVFSIKRYQGESFSLDEGFICYTFFTDVIYIILKRIDLKIIIVILAIIHAVLFDITH